jgi:hypothetical protein
MRHKHADLIHAWAEGAEIEGRHYPGEEWQSLKGADCVTWSVGCQYRIKPEKKPDVVRYALIEKDNWTACVASQGCPKDNLRVTFSGETGELIKAEVL